MGIDLTGLADGYARILLPDDSLVDVKMVDAMRSTVVTYKVVVDEQMMSPELAATYMMTQRNYWRGAADHHIREADKYRTAYADAMELLRKHGLANDREAVDPPEEKPPLKLVDDEEKPDA